MEKKMKVKFPDVTISNQNAPAFFAEIGSYYNGDINSAIEMVEQISIARDAVPQTPVFLKTEILHSADICLPGDDLENYVNKSGKLKKESWRSIIERKVMSSSDYARLFQYANSKSLPFIVSVYDFYSADLSKDNGAACLKIASANIVHVPLIRYVAKLGLPMMIDTGRATLSEVERAINTARDAGATNILLQHSPDGHPAAPEAHNLKILQSYEQLFSVPVGLSDHYTGHEMMYLAIAMGASHVEKGVFHSPDMLDQDISHSMHIEEMPKVLEMLHDSWLALGSYKRDSSMRIKGNIGTSQRQCLVAKLDAKPGDNITLENTTFAFPCKGIPVEEWDRVEKWKVRKDIHAGQPIQWCDLEPTTT